MKANRPSSSSILAIGTSLPAASAGQDELFRLMAELHGFTEDTSEGRASRRRLRTLYRRSRIRRRHAVACGREEGMPVLVDDLAGRDEPPSTARRMELYRRHAPALVAEACETALARAGAPPREAIAHVFVVSCTGFFAPSLDVELVDRLGLSPDVGRTLVGFQGCQGGLTALRVADAACRADPDRVALVACVELCSLHYQADPTDDNLLANALFCDGASATLVGGDALPPSAAPHLAIERCATWLQPESRDEMTWNVTDTGFRLHLGSHVPRLLASDARPFLAERLGVGSIEEARRCTWAVHPGGAAILEWVERSFELEDQLRHSWGVLADCGNMSSATVHFVLERALHDAVDGETVLALAFGPGLTIEGARLRARVP